MGSASTELTARERLALELEEIDAKCEKLKMFLYSDIYNKLTIEEQKLVSGIKHLKLPLIKTAVKANQT
jgi:hypothetical protein